MRCWSRKTLYWMLFQGSDCQSSVRCTGVFLSVPAIRLLLFEYLYNPIVRAHVSVSSVLRRALTGLCFLGNLFSRRLIGGSLLDVSTAIENRRKITLFRMFIFRDRRMVLYAGPRLSERHCALPSARPEALPFWGLPVDRFWQVICSDASTHLHLRYP